MSEEQKKHTFYVHGMHCNSCVVLTESELNELPHIQSAEANLKECCVEVTGIFGEKTTHEIAEELSSVLRPHGYSLSLERERRKTIWTDFIVAVPIAAFFIGLFILLQKLGIVNLISSGTVTYQTAFLIGLIASVSTCMAVVGGLVLALSANFAKGGDSIRPQIFFHIGRFLAFFLLGGIIGMLGATFQVNATGTFVLGVAVAVVLLLLGVHLLDIFPWTKKMQLTLPSVFGKRISALQKMNHVVTPFLLGGATFFLPCGFTQSMQFYTLTTGSFIAGALTMSVFALGTFPVLALLSFSPLGTRAKTTSGIFFKTAGIVVIFFGLLNLFSSLAAYGVIKPFFNF